MGITQKDDRYKSGWKVESYPYGQETFYLDGRLLLDVIKFDVRGFIAIPPGVNFVAALLGVVPQNRAVYIDYISISGSTPYTLNNATVWQLWGSGKYLVAGTFSEKPVPIRIYVPPETVLTFYYGFFNATGNPIYVYAWMSAIEYSAEKDIWEYGNGGNTPNPAAAVIPWP